jgi:hypothetical protein
MDSSVTTAETVRKNGLDKFYTLPEIAERCLASIGSLYKWWEWDLVIEPSAGNGSFFLRIPTEKKIGVDISPEHVGIVQSDYFQYALPDTLKGKKILVVGNPPFGKVCSLAIQFFHHSAQWASVIAFVIPRTFRRVSIQNRLPLHYHLVLDEDIPCEPCSFTPPMMVKCCFQIWERRTDTRQKVHLPTTHRDWEFLSLGPNDSNGQPTPPTGAHFALLAYGGSCGRIVDSNLNSLRPKSWHWIRANIPIATLQERFRSLDYSCSRNTARQNSIGRGELVSLYSCAYE